MMSPAQNVSSAYQETDTESAIQDMVRVKSALSLFVMLFFVWVFVLSASDTVLPWIFEHVQ